jgi:hypothetical protein
MHVLMIMYKGLSLRKKQLYLKKKSYKITDFFSKSSQPRKHCHKHFFSFTQEYIRIHNFKLKMFLPLSYQSFFAVLEIKPICMIGLAMYRNDTRIQHSSISQDLFFFLHISFKDDWLWTSHLSAYFGWNF